MIRVQVIAIFSASPCQKAGSATLLSWLGQPPSYEIDEQIAARGYKQGKSQSKRRAEPFGGEIECKHRDRETAESDHCVRHDGRGGRSADTMVQDEHDAAQHDGKHRKIAARRRTDAKTERDHRPDQQRDHDREQNEIVPSYMEAGDRKSTGLNSR